MAEQGKHGTFVPERRTLLKAGMLSCAAVAAGGLGLFRTGKVQAAPPSSEAPKEDFIYTCCVNNCGSSCVLKAIVRDDKVVRIETDNGVKDDWENGIFQVRACPRGRSMRRHMYSPERLKYPMKRVGKRGEGKFERISWDEALDTVAKKLRYCIDTYGNESVLSHYASGSTVGAMVRREAFYRLMNLLGGFSLGTSDYSSAQNQAGLKYLYGKPGYSGNAITDIANTKLAVFFGINITETRMSGGGLQYELLRAKEKSGAKIIVIDPRYSDTCVSVADEWIPIRPGTDAALASALAYVLINENMVDREFLATYSIGFDAASMPEGAPEKSSYSDYILGTGYDGIAKTPAWAAKITGIPADRIIRLAREIGQAKPCFISQGWGLQRQAAGEMNTVSVAALATLTGNVGLRGGGNGDYDSYYPGPSPRIPAGTNPVKAKFPTFMWLKAVEDGKSLTSLHDGVTGADRFPTDIKFIWNYAGNTLLNQHAEINHTRKVLEDDKKCEMIVVMDTHLTASAKFADILLPSCVYPEQTDIFGPSYAMDIDWLLVSGSVKPFFESRPVFEVCADLAKRLGVGDQYTEGRDHEGWVDFLYQTSCRKAYPELPETVKEARALGVIRRPKSRVLPVPFADFREDPAQHPLKTPSGKIELYSPALAKIGQTWELGKAKGDVIPPTPQYVATWEGFEDEEGKKDCPLQMIGYHYKGRTHSHYAHLDWMLEVSPQTLWINPVDAEARGLKHGDVARVFNKRGEVRIRVKVTPRIIPGVVAMPQGAWYSPDAGGVDVGGCINTLTSYHPSPLAKGNPQHTNLVQVARG